MCGFTRVEDVHAAIEAGVDAIGLNFYRSSPRFADKPLVEKLVRAIDKRVLVVGVFVNETWSEMLRSFEAFCLDAIQLHGTEQVTQLPDDFVHIPIIKALPWRSDSHEDPKVANAWSSSASQMSLKGLLVDAYDPVQHGGTGRVVRWDLLNPRPTAFSSSRLILAGGLTPENVEHAISVACPDAIDTASGIESSPGIKSAQRMQEFVQAVRKTSVRGHRWLAEPR